MVVGAGGFAREVKWLVSDLNARKDSYRFLGFVVSALANLGEHDSSEEVLGDIGWLEEHRTEVDSLAIGIGNPSIRLSLGRDLSRKFPSIDWPALVHPSVMMDQGSVKLGKGVLVCAGVIGTVNLQLEDFSMVNLACTLGHESVIGAGSVLNPTVNVSGGVFMGEGVLVGTGAQILQYVSVGHEATIGAGAVVTKDVGPGETVVGIPARPLRS